MAKGAKRFKWLDLIIKIEIWKITLYVNYCILKFTFYSIKNIHYNNSNLLEII